MSKSYDPWGHAQSLGLVIVEKRLRHGRRGEYSHDDGTVLLAPGMSLRECRSVLAHEVQHALVGDVPSRSRLVNARQELRARRATARALIDPSEYAAAERLRGPHLASIAYDLNVTVHVINDWIALQSAIDAA